VKLINFAKDYATLLSAIFNSDQIAFEYLKEKYNNYFKELEQILKDAKDNPFSSYYYKTFLRFDQRLINKHKEKYREKILSASLKLQNTLLKDLASKFYCNLYYDSIDLTNPEEDYLFDRYIRKKLDEPDKVDLMDRKTIINFFAEKEFAKSGFRVPIKYYDEETFAKVYESEDFKNTMAFHCGDINGSELIAINEKYLLSREQKRFQSLLFDCLFTLNHELAHARVYDSFARFDGLEYDYLAFMAVMEKTAHVSQVGYNYIYSFEEIFANMQAFKKTQEHLTPYLGCGCLEYNSKPLERKEHYQRLAKTPLYYEGDDNNQDNENRDNIFERYSYIHQKVNNRAHLERENFSPSLKYLYENGFRKSFSRLLCDCVDHPKEISDEKAILFYSQLLFDSLPFTREKPLDILSSDFSWLENQEMCSTIFDKMDELLKTRYADSQTKSKNRDVIYQLKKESTFFGQIYDEIKDNNLTKEDINIAMSVMTELSKRIYENEGNINVNIMKDSIASSKSEEPAIKRIKAVMLDDEKTKNICLAFTSMHLVNNENYQENTIVLSK